VCPTRHYTFHVLAAEEMVHALAVQGMVLPRPWLLPLRYSTCWTQQAALHPQHRRVKLTAVLVGDECTVCLLTSRLGQHIHHGLDFLLKQHKRGLALDMKIVVCLDVWSSNLLSATLHIDGAECYAQLPCVGQKSGCSRQAVPLSTGVIQFPKL